MGYMRLPVLKAGWVLLNHALHGGSAPPMAPPVLVLVPAIERTRLVKPNPAGLQLGKQCDADVSPPSAEVVDAASVFGGGAIEDSLQRTAVAFGLQSGNGLRVETSCDQPDAEQLERVFEPFWRADSARSSRGSGLGLTLAKRIVEALGGQIEATNTGDTGARFDISVPTRA